MYKEEIANVAYNAKKKAKYMNERPVGYIVNAMMAGMFIALGYMFIFTIGGYLHDTHVYKIVMGACFGIAFSLVVMAGGELFTGNNMIMFVGVNQKVIRTRDLFKNWVLCWGGNFLGGCAVAVVFYFTDVATGDIGEFFAYSAYVKMTLTIPQLISRGILCNVLVCLVTWCYLKMKSESGKLIMIFWCLFAFVTSGYEHSIANMGLLVLAYLNPMGYEITIGMVFYNLFFVTIGNIIGGIVFVALPYLFIAKNNGECKDMHH